MSAIDSVRASAPAAGCSKCLSRGAPCAHHGGRTRNGQKSKVSPPKRRVTRPVVVEAALRPRRLHRLDGGSEYRIEVVGEGRSAYLHIATADNQKFVGTISVGRLLRHLVAIYFGRMIARSER